MMSLDLALPDDLRPWAEAQRDLPAAIIGILRAHVAGSGLAIAAARLRAAIPSLPFEFEFEVPQAIGEATWSQLDRSTRLSFGKQVKREAVAFGLVFVRKTSANHAIYKRAAV